VENNNLARQPDSPQKNPHGKLTPESKGTPRPRSLAVTDLGTRNRGQKGKERDQRRKVIRGEKKGPPRRRLGGSDWHTRKRSVPQKRAQPGIKFTSGASPRRQTVHLSKAGPGDKAEKTERLTASHLYKRIGARGFGIPFR